MGEKSFNVQEISPLFTSFHLKALKTLKTLFLILNFSSVCLHSRYVIVAQNEVIVLRQQYTLSLTP